MIDWKILFKEDDYLLLSLYLIINNLSGVMNEIFAFHALIFFIFAATYGSILILQVPFLLYLVVCTFKRLLWSLSFNISIYMSIKQNRKGFFFVKRLTKFQHLLSVRLRTKWLWVQVKLLSLKLQILCLFRGRSSLTFRQLQSVHSL